MLGPILRRQVLHSRPALRQALPTTSSLARWYASYPPHTIVKMPALSPTMTAGNIGAWQKKPGDSIAPGDVLVEIETDKAQMDFEFQEEGVLAKVLKDQGEKDVAVGNPIAVLVEEGADISAFEGFSIADAGGDAAAPAENKEEPKKDESSAPEPTPEPAPEPQDTASSGRLETALQREPNAAPAAKRLAIEQGIKLSAVKGSGPGGKITEDDVKKASAAPAAGAAASSGAAYEDIPLSGMRKTIANRLQQSVRENPHFFVSSSISVSKLLKLRQALNSSAEGKYKLSVNDFLIKAIASAAKKVPAANSSWQNDTIRQYNTVDVSVAVATPTGLITPIVRAAEGKGLEAISASVKDLAKRARDNKLKPEEYQGGSISISNMGMNPAVDSFTAIINPPQSTILAIGSPKKVAIPSENESGVAWDDQITITGSFDHKVVDGAVGAEFMKELKKVVENPLELLL
ncbi:dihydrolipoyllysine-residue acetyltransferase component-pyruvate dehydrogenase complex [Diaporthe amygdali]|uniref:dihydrolipoyllysine-residue acetyltransferase component-pyruvate dehydrogenase complex n=1 Tax=Phomopsis amygdali TaxID=1214568 RepID=UPI0022FE46C5|nr:dihydrolipoyllysine-residue acetyltransferase component-pyruvate dehydrogenase complex [Diaporthe amygdali]KAJ0118598.1 dihydrolipoyllysine-residue acetyltransferase component-pyruvate dehydrogenase complex [Diaporthe amygdali]